MAGVTCVVQPFLVCDAQPGKGVEVRKKSQCNSDSSRFYACCVRAVRICVWGSCVGDPDVKFPQARCPRACNRDGQDLVMCLASCSTPPRSCLFLPPCPCLFVQVSCALLNASQIMSGPCPSVQVSGALLNASQIMSALSCNLRELGLGNNQLNGAVPDDITLLSDLRSLGLGYNRLTGPLPASLGNLSSLQELEVTSNELTGQSDESWRDISTPGWGVLGARCVHAWAGSGHDVQHAVQSIQSLAGKALQGGARI
eukprot:353810-Chlamydomonas_euryale.AAC.7